jgi:hypothetical protein
MLDRIKKHPVVVAVVALFAVAAALVYFLNALPDFFDKTFPWFREHLAVVGVTVQQGFAVVVMAAAFLLFAVVIFEVRKHVPTTSPADPLIAELVQEAARLKGNFEQVIAERDALRGRCDRLETTLDASLILDDLLDRANAGLRLWKRISKSDEEAETLRRTEVRQWERKTRKTVQSSVPNRLAEYDRPDPLPGGQAISWQLSLGEHLMERIQRLLQMVHEQQDRIKPSTPGTPKARPQ